MSAAELAVNLCGGVALLLWGVRMVRKRVERAFGERLNAAVEICARGRARGFFVGAGLAGALQSSAAAALIVASFAERGLVPGAAALALVLGADVGSSLVVQALSFRIPWLAPLLIAAGGLAFALSKSRRMRNIARAVLGVGFVLLALHMIMAASEPLRESAAIVGALRALESAPLLAFFLAALLTWLAHSSVAIVLMIASLAAGGVIGLPLALALVLGANLGGAIVPAALTLHGQAPAARVGLGNLFMRGAGAFAALWFVPLIMPFLLLADDGPARAVVNLHLAFNLGLAILFLPFVGPVSKLTEWLIRDREGSDAASLADIEFRSHS
ncbi:MAG: Na/Pi symporter [Amphiplicatus sp.]